MKRNLFLKSPTARKEAIPFFIQIGVGFIASFTTVSRKLIQYEIGLARLHLQFKASEPLINASLRGTK